MKLQVSEIVVGMLVAASAAVSAAEMKVEQYDGPTKCDDKDKVKKGDFLSMHYTGTIDKSSPTGTAGEKFDSSRDRGQTFDFQIGVGQVIKGWDEGIVGLCKGARATLILPSEYAYGDAGAGGAIPGKATLNFDVEVVDISDEAKGPPPPPNVFKQIDTDKDGKLSKEEIESFFKSMGKDVPEGLWENEDRDGSGFIDHDEFSGPKEDHESHDEL